MTDPADILPEELSEEDESDAEYSDSSDEAEVPERNLSSSIVFLQRISRYVDRACTCNRPQGVIFLLNNQPQVLNTECTGNDCIVASIQALLSFRSDIGACLKLLSLDGIISLRSLPSDRTNGLPYKVLQIIDALTQISLGIINVLNGHINQSVLDKEMFQGLKELGLFALSYFNSLAYHLKDICTDTYLRITTDIAIMGRRLAQKGLYYTLPSPSWSFFETKNLLPHCITYQEALCEHYLTTGRVKEAWIMVYEVFETDINLVSEKIVKVLSFILLNHKIFNDAQRQSQLGQVMKQLPHVSNSDDILVLGVLLYWQNVIEHTEKVIETLMSKAGHLLEIWMHWFHSVGSQLIDEAGFPRADVSLRFLRKFAELAIVNFQNFAAVKSLCAAYNLAHKMKKWDVVKDVTQIIVTLMPQLGLHMGHDDPENTDLFMNSVGLGPDSGLLGLVAIASHHLNTNQLQKFLHVRDAFFRKLSSTRQNSAKIDIDFSHAVMKRLQAELLLLPGCKQLDEKDGPYPQALILAVSAFKLIEDVKQYKFYFPKDVALDNVLGPWQIVHEYLCVAKLTGELFSHTGDVKAAKIYFGKGLEAAEKLKLDTWAAIFHSKLVQHAFVNKNFTDAAERLQDAQSFIECSLSTLKPCLQSGHGKPTIEFVSRDTLQHGLVISRDTLQHGLEMTNSKKDQTSSCCQKKSNLRQDLISDLMEMDSRSYDRKDQMSCYFILTDTSGCCDCCQSEFIASCINIMYFQAKMLWRKERSKFPVSSLLQCSLLMANMFARMPLSTNIMELFTSAGLKVYNLSQTKSSDRILSDTAYQCVDIYSRILDPKSKKSDLYSDAENIMRLLEFGKRVGEYGMCNVVASALLLKNSINNLSVLKTPLNGEKVLETRSYRLSTVHNIITLTVQESKQQSNINVQSGHSSAETVSDEEKPACADSISEGSGSDNTECSLKWKNLIENFLCCLSET